MPNVFLSYNREDRPRAKLVAEALVSEGLSVWWDTALRAGENYDEVTERNLREADAVVVLWSKRSVQSKWVRAEATLGQRKSALVPAMIEECDRPLLFELIQTADLIRWEGDRDDPEWRGFIDVIQARVGESKRPAPQARAAAAPSTTRTAAHDDKARHIEAAAALHAATIETTFWQSIKDGSNIAEFEAYLDRYPNGHFAALARNRIAALKTPKPAPKPAAEATPAPAAQVKAPPAAPSRPAPAQAGRMPPQARPPASAPLRTSRLPKRKLNLGLIAALVVLLGAGGGGAWFWMNMRAGNEADGLASQAAPGAPANATEANITSATGPAALSAPAPVADAGTEPAEATAGPLVIADQGGQPAAASQQTAPALIGSNGKGSAEAKTLKDCAECPELAMLPAGSFQMGSAAEEPGRYGYEGPQHEVALKSFAIGKHEVTFDEWDACVAGGGCNGFKPADRGWGRGSRPVVGVSWHDAKAYLSWLSRKTGRSYRLPTEAEWEYAARGGSSTAYPWGAHFDGSRMPHNQPAPAASFAANAFGLYDMIGNAAEWVEDCYQSNYVGAPADGSPIGGACENHTFRGGSYKSAPTDLRVANRGRNSASVRAAYMGFRVALSP